MRKCVVVSRDDEGKNQVLGKSDYWLLSALNLQNLQHRIQNKTKGTRQTVEGNFCLCQVESQY